MDLPELEKYYSLILYRLSLLSGSRTVIDTQFEMVSTHIRVKKQSVPIVILDKHVGEMDPHEMAETVMNDEGRTLKQITMEDAQAVATTFINSMGEAVTPRKKFIEENAWRANIDV